MKTYFSINILHEKRVEKVKKSTNHVKDNFWKEENSDEDDDIIIDDCDDDRSDEDFATSIYKFKKKITLCSLTPI